MLYSMDQRLRKCAEDGDVDALYSILSQDPDALERLDPMQFVDTPLHIAASAGNTRFAMEIATLKPSFAWKLNQLGLSPMHLALHNGHDLIVRGMLRKIDTELVRIKGKGSLTPLHYVAQTDNVDMLVSFLRVCSSSIEELTAELETAVHVAVKNNSLNAFKVLLGWLRRVDKEYILEWKDGDGNTVLHIATSANQPQVMKLLIGNVKVNNTNLVNNMTAMDIFDLQRDSLDREVGCILDRVKAKRFSELAGSTTSDADYLSRDLSFSEKMIKCLGIVGRSKASRDISSVVLVVAILIATATYQAGLSPPGGYWQDANPPENITMTSSNTTNSNSQKQQPHPAGQMILNPLQLVIIFTCNSIAFYTSVCIILVIITGLPFSFILYISTYFLLFSYTFSLTITFPPGVGPYIFMFVSFVSACLAFFIPGITFSKYKKLKRWLSYEK